MKLSKKIIIIACTLALIAFLISIDLSFINGGITERGVYCPKNFHEGNGCYTLGSTTYFPKASRQVVLAKSEFGVQTYKKCSVIDRKNWECKFDDESGTFGFVDGNFHSIPLYEDLSKLPKDEIYLNTSYVSKFRYILEELSIL